MKTIKKIGMCPICFKTFEIPKDLRRKIVMCAECISKHQEEYGERQRFTPHPCCRLPDDLLLDFHLLVKKEAQKQARETFSDIELELCECHPHDSILESGNLRQKFISDNLKEIPQTELLNLLIKQIMSNEEFANRLNKRIAAEILQSTQEKIGGKYPLDAPSLALAAIFLATKDNVKIVVIDTKNQVTHFESGKEADIKTLMPHNLKIEWEVDNGYNYQYQIGSRAGGNFVATVALRSKYSFHTYEHTVLIFAQPEN